MSRLIDHGHGGDGLVKFAGYYFDAPVSGGNGVTAQDVMTEAATGKELRYDMKRCPHCERHFHVVVNLRKRYCVLCNHQTCGRQACDSNCQLLPKPQIAVR